MNTSPHTRVTVLVVDDSDDQANLLRLHLEHAGCNVMISASAEHAMEIYRTVELDFAVIDLMLPGMSGWELAQRIKEDLPDCALAISSVLDLDSYPPIEARLPKPVNRQSVRAALMEYVPRWAAQAS